MLKPAWRSPRVEANLTLQDGIGTPVKLLKGGRWGAGAEATVIVWRGRAHPETYFNAHDGVRFAVDASVVRDALETRAQALSGERK